MADETPKRFPFPTGGKIDVIISAAERLREARAREHNSLGTVSNEEMRWDEEEKKTERWVEELRNIMRGVIISPPSLASQLPPLPSQSNLPVDVPPTPLWAISLSRPLPSTILKGQFFQVEIQLESLAEAIFPEDVKVPVEVSLISVDDERMEIEEDYMGNPILSGQRRAYLRYDRLTLRHSASFRISILAASTDYPSSFFHLQVRPSPSPSSLPFPNSVTPLRIPQVSVLGRTHYMARRRKEGRRSDRVDSRFSEDEDR